MPQGAPTGRGLSLWWMPPRPVGERLQGLVDALAGRLGTPAFVPHVTVESGLSAAPEEIAAALAATPDARTSPILRAGAVRAWPSWNRTLVVELERDPPVLEARTAVCTALGRTVMPSSFQPHLSLVYGPLPEELRERLAATVKVDLPPFRPVALALVDTTGEVRDWWEIQRWPLAGAA